MKIQATNTGLCLRVNTCNMISSLLSLGYPICNTDTATPLYNDNDACVKWCHNMTTIGNQHIENCKNAVHEWVADGTLTILHVSGKTNIADIFTKEMHNSVNFCRLCYSLMCRSSDTTGVSTSWSKPLALCLHKQRITLRCPIPPSSRFLHHTFPSASRKLSPVSWLLDAISYLILHPLFPCRLLWAILWGVLLHSLLIPVIVILR